MRPRSNMKLSRQDLEKITDLTLSHYNERAEDFWEGTRDHNVNQNITALLQCIEGEPPFTILEFGCGPGRDLKAFAELGHIAVGLEGAAHFAVMARAHSDCEVWQQDFLKLDLPDRHFDGVFATTCELPISAMARPSGVATSALGHKRTFAVQNGMSALPPKATAKADFRRKRLLHPQKRTCAV